MKILMWGVRGAFPPSVAMVVTVFCSLPAQELFFLIESRHSGHPESSCLKQDDSCVVLRRRRRDKRQKEEKWETKIWLLRRGAIYLRKADCPVGILEWRQCTLLSSRTQFEGECQPLRTPAVGALP